MRPFGNRNGSYKKARIIREYPESPTKLIQSVLSADFLKIERQEEFAN